MNYPWQPKPWRPRKLKMKGRRRLSPVQQMVLAGICLALALILPFFTGQIPQVGKALSPMHIPILICGFICGWRYGLGVGAIAPVLRSFLFGMPVMLPSAAAMSFELATYGLITALLWNYLRQETWGIYISLIIAMFLGRLVWGIASYGIFKLMGSAFTWQMFIAGAFVNAVPGIVLHILLIPPIVMALRRARLL